jgi:hypothetical protein
MNVWSYAVSIVTAMFNVIYNFWHVISLDHRYSFFGYNVKTQRGLSIEIYLSLGVTVFSCIALLLHRYGWLFSVTVSKTHDNLVTCLLTNDDFWVVVDDDGDQLL